jgi:hypothetical protein
MFAAFGGAGIAYRCAQHAQLVHEWRPMAHERRRLPADGRTVTIVADAIDHALDVVFVETRVGTMMTLLSATHTRLDARLMLLVGHGDTRF